MATVQMQRTIAVAVFHDRADAQKAVKELRRKGFLETDIGVASRDGGEVVAVVEKGGKGDKVATGAAAGAATGAGLGALWGLGVMAGVVPAIGPVIAGGTLAAILASSAIGAGAAGVAGALVGLGIPEEEARHYESEFNAGRTIVSVRTAAGRYDEAMEIMKDQGAEESRFA